MYMIYMYNVHVQMLYMYINILTMNTSLYMYTHVYMQDKLHDNKTVCDPSMYMYMYNYTVCTMYYRPPQTQVLR